MGLLVPSSGRSLEVYGNVHPRWMITTVYGTELGLQVNSLFFKEISCKG